MAFSNLKHSIVIPTTSSAGYGGAFDMEFVFCYQLASVDKVKRKYVLDYEIWFVVNKPVLDNGYSFLGVRLDGDAVIGIYNTNAPGGWNKKLYFNNWNYYPDADGESPTLARSGQLEFQWPNYGSALHLSAELTSSSIMYLSANGNEHETGNKTWKIQGASLEELPEFNDQVLVTGATNFTEEERNPSITYTNSTNLTQNGTYGLVKAEACISITGGNDDVPYREIPMPRSDTDTRTYTFDLSDEDIAALYPATATNKTGVVRFYIKSTLRNGDVYWDYVDRTFTVTKDYEPVFSPVLKDTNPTTLALTGNENILVKHHSNVYFESGAQGRKGASIASEFAVNGSQTIKEATGIFEGIESNTFTFNATDTRGISSQLEVQPHVVEYIKPTCVQEVHLTLVDTNTAEAQITVTGNYFNGFFGAVGNELKLEIRHTNLDGKGMTEWADVTPLLPDISNNTYSLSFNVRGFNGGTSYTFQCRASDKLGSATTKEYTARVFPIFDWSETDFNFNVPVNINAEGLTMNGETIIRHSATTNNTVLSATGGHIYLRPGGTSDTSGETIIYPDGSIKFGGAVDFGDSFMIDGNTLADYVIETGEESMGSNGTWYWRKWKSGKAEAWGCRNFGNMAVTTAWGSLYRGAILTQDLPNNVFIRTPDAININIVHSNFGGWICKHEQTAPSADTTGSFIFVRPASATVSPTNIGFYVAGEWQ